MYPLPRINKSLNQLLGLGGSPLSAYIVDIRRRAKHQTPNPKPLSPPVLASDSLQICNLASPQSDCSWFHSEGLWSSRDQLHLQTRVVQTTSGANWSLLPVTVPGKLLSQKPAARMYWRLYMGNLKKAHWGGQWSRFSRTSIGTPAGRMLRLTATVVTPALPEKVQLVDPGTPCRINNWAVQWRRPCTPHVRLTTEDITSFALWSTP